MEKLVFTIIWYLSFCDTQVPVSTLSHQPNYQTLQIFTQNCCNGKSENYTNQIRDLESVSIILSKKRMKSFSVHWGMWYLSPSPNFTARGVYYVDNYHYEGDESLLKGTCGSTAPSSGSEAEGFTQYKSIRFVGNSRFKLPGLSLYSKDGFGGNELYFDGRILRLPEPITVNSYGFTGRAKDIWRVFPYRNFSGPELCWEGDKHKIVNFAEKVEFQVGSILRTTWKCDKSENGSAKEQETLALKSKNLITINNQLILYFGPGPSRLQTDSYELRLPQATTFLSYSFVGISNWTIYSEIDFTGNFLCLPNTPKLNKKGAPAKNKLNAKVGSVRRGCVQDSVSNIYDQDDELYMAKMDSMNAVGTFKSTHSFIIVILHSLIILVILLMLK